MEDPKLRLSEFLDLAKLVQSYVEAYGLSYEEAIERAKEKLLSEGCFRSSSEGTSWILTIITTNIMFQGFNKFRTLL